MARPKKQELGNTSSFSDLKNRLKKNIKTEFTQDFENDDDKVSIAGWIDTGVIALNTIISGDPYKGIPLGRVTQFAGPESSAKSYICKCIAGNAQKQGYFILYYDSEMSIENKEEFETFGIDTDQMLYTPVKTLEEVNLSVMSIIREAQPQDKIIVIIDSLGNLSTKKEMEDTFNDADKKDMTRASKIKQLFRTITIDAGLKQMPIIIVNHVYASIGSYIQSNVISGGSGIKYANSATIEFSRSQDKEGTDVVGAIITAKATKNRFCKVGSKIQFKINFGTGIKKYSGLIDNAVEAGYVTIPAKGFFMLKDSDVKMRGKDFTDEIWQKILDMGFDKWLEKKYKLNSGSDVKEMLTELEDEVEENDPIYDGIEENADSAN